MAESDYAFDEERAAIERRIADKGHSYGPPVVFEGRVTFVPNRWTVGIKVEPKDGPPVYLVASADSADTFGDGIWFGPLAEWVDRRNE